jgi:hypothetical protein
VTIHNQTDPVSCTTSSAGTCTITVDKIQKPRPSALLMVNAVSGPVTWDGAAASATALRPAGI